MSFPNLAIQGIAGAQQRVRRHSLYSNYSGLSGLGDVSDQALRNSVVDVVLNIGQAWRVLSYTKTLTQSLRDRLNNSGFRVLNIDDSNLALLTGGTMRVRVQVLTDGYANAADAASVVGGAAAALGYNVTSSSGVLVSSGDSTSGGGASTGQSTGQSGQQYDPTTTTGNAGGIGDSISSFVQSLTQSPTTLAVILGAAVILVIAAKK